MNKHSYLITLVPLRLLFLFVLSLMVASMQGQDENVVSLDYMKAPLSKALDTLRAYTNDYNITFVHNDIEHLQDYQARMKSCTPLTSSHLLTRTERYTLRSVRRTTSVNTTSTTRT